MKQTHSENFGVHNNLFSETEQKQTHTNNNKEIYPRFVPRTRTQLKTIMWINLNYKPNTFMAEQC